MSCFICGLVRIDGIGLEAQLLRLIFILFISGNRTRLECMLLTGCHYHQGPSELYGLLSLNAGVDWGG